MRVKSNPIVRFGSQLGFVAVVLAALTMLSPAGASATLAPIPSPRPTPTCTTVCGIKQVATDRDIPWGVGKLPDGRMIYTRRDTHEVVLLNTATGARSKAGTVPNVVGTDGEGGLLGLAVSPHFATDHWIYFMHTSPTDDRIVRIRLLGNTLDTAHEQVLLTGIKKNRFHNGGRLRFAPDGTLYASTGDAEDGNNAQNLNSLNGKILRLNADGTIPSTNPFHNYVWSYGHRNPEGIAFDADGRLWEQEFGNTVEDETNLIVRGGNYGWPTCEGTTGACNTPGFIAPKQTYSTADGSCSGLTVVREVVYVACEMGQRLYRFLISGSSLTSKQSFFTGVYGRLRTVERDPDGGLWLTTSNGGDKDSIPNNSTNKIFELKLCSASPVA